MELESSYQKTHLKFVSPEKRRSRLTGKREIPANDDFKGDIEGICKRKTIKTPT
jgi:hypothetical protein